MFVCHVFSECSNTINTAVRVLCYLCVSNNYFYKRVCTCVFPNIIFFYKIIVAFHIFLFVQEFQRKLSQLTPEQKRLTEKLKIMASNRLSGWY